MRTKALLFLLCMGLASRTAGLWGASAGAPRPAGVHPVWDLGRAYAVKTPTRERICLNGLWRWQPASADAEAVPAGRWGYFDVPGPWPGIADYLEKDCQTLYPHPDWKDESLAGVTAAWYQREITVPGDWAGRRVTVAAQYLNSLATVYVDGRRIGAMRFPGGEVDLTAACRPGTTHLLSMHVIALPLHAVMLPNAETAARPAKGAVARRGLCGDVYLIGVPRAERIEEVRVRTSVRRGEITFDASLAGLRQGALYTLRAVVREQDEGSSQTGPPRHTLRAAMRGRHPARGENRTAVRSGRPGGTETGSVVRAFTSPPFRAGDLRNGRFTFSARWMPRRLWDLNTPGNVFTAQVSVTGPGGKLLDMAEPVRSGFREFWIQGRDFYLNGTRIFLSASALNSAQVGAAWAGYEGALETLRRLKSFGVNFVYTGNYDCEPGSHLSYAEILRAADDAGMLVALTQPHFSAYDWRSPDADRVNGYARHAAFYVSAAGSHPSVVAYAMSHNALGSVEDANPDMIDGIRDLHEPYARESERRALRAQAIVQRLDPGRIVYHHAAGNVGAMHTLNFYVNFTPAQELSDWFEHWATRGVKPLFLVEYASPFSWDWTMYRGWYRGKREWGSAEVPWEFCLAEWDAQFLGDPAYRIGEREKANLRWEAAQFREGRVWHRWDYPTPVGSGVFEDRNRVIADYLTANWRAYRTWGVSGISPWDHEMYWLLRDGVVRRRIALPVDWGHLQRPGFSADYLDEQPDDMVLAHARSDWIPTAAARAVIRNNRPLLAYIAGKPERFTSRDHNFRAGETFRKQLIVLNNSRASVSADCRWTLRLPAPVTGQQKVVVPTGGQVRIPLRFTLPAGLAAGPYELSATIRFSTGEVQRDTFALDVLPPPPPIRADAKIALFDPEGETARMLQASGIRYQPVGAAADLSPYDLLIVGKGALTRDGPAPDLHRVRDGLKVIVMEQTAAALEVRLGFRVEEYGLRQVFRRVPDHPLLVGLDEATLRDWRGEATLLPPRLSYTVGERYAPTVKWCGIDVTRVWRCGCRGNVASVLIEKPARGDFLPLLDGGYSLQYSPLTEYREGRGMVLFCQMDVTGRTDDDPAADRLFRNLLQYACTCKPAPQREAIYAGDPEGRAYLEAAGFTLRAYGGESLPPDAVLIVAPGGGRQLAGQRGAIRDWIRSGGHLAAIGLDQADADGLFAGKVRMRVGEHIAAYFDPPRAISPLVGIGPADVQNRDPRNIPLVAGASIVASDIVVGTAPIGDGVLAEIGGTNAVSSQLAPWEFGPTKGMNLKRTFRRAAYLTTRLIANMGVPSSTPLLDRFGSPAGPAMNERRWINGLYLDTPEERDDPYRFFGW